jgi:hypothetical protein
MCVVDGGVLINRVDEGVCQWVRVSMILGGMEKPYLQN